MACNTVIDSFTGTQNYWPWIKDLHPSDSTDSSAVGQCFETPGGNIRYKICKVRFLMQRLGANPRTMEARLYEITGTYGVDAKPTGNPLAISDELDILSFGTGEGWRTLTFPEDQQFLLESNHYYCIIILAKSGTWDDNNDVQMRANNLDPHGGNYVNFVNGSWFSSSNIDLHFEVYGNPGLFSLSESLLLSPWLIIDHTYPEGFLFLEDLIKKRTKKFLEEQKGIFDFLSFQFEKLLKETLTFTLKQWIGVIFYEYLTLKGQISQFRIWLYESLHLASLIYPGLIPRIRKTIYLLYRKIAKLKLQEGKG